MIFEHLLCIVLLVIAVEGATEIIVASEITSFARDFLFRWAFGLPTDPPAPDSYYRRFKAKIHKLFTCGYCMSAWVSMFFSLFCPVSLFESSFINWLVITIVVHRLSNYYHVVYQLHKLGRVATSDIIVKLADEVSIKVREDYGSDGTGSSQISSETAAVDSGPGSGA